MALSVGRRGLRPAWARTKVGIGDFHAVSELRGPVATGCKRYGDIGQSGLVAEAYRVAQAEETKTVVASASAPTPPCCLSATYRRHMRGLQGGKDTHAQP